MAQPNGVSGCLRVGDGNALKLVFLELGKPKWMATSIA
jgi:hypothetical protein